jgi:hypothetical protein
VVFAKVSEALHAELGDRFGHSMVTSFVLASKWVAMIPVMDANQLDPREAMMLAIADALVCNADRTRANPNCGLGEDGLVAFDFGASLVSPKWPAGHPDLLYTPTAVRGRLSEHVGMVSARADFDSYTGILGQRILALDIDSLLRAEGTIDPSGVHAKVLAEVLNYLQGERVPLLQRLGDYFRSWPRSA